MLQFIENHRVFSTGLFATALLLAVLAVSANNAKESPFTRTCSIDSSQLERIEKAADLQRNDTTATEGKKHGTTFQALRIGSRQLVVAREANCFLVITRNERTAHAYRGVMEQYSNK